MNGIIFNQISVRIIKEQALIIGPLAWEEASKVSGFSVIDARGEKVSFSGNEKEVIDNLVAQYQHLFGRASREVCKEAVQDLIAEMPPDQIPSSLR